MQQIDFDNNLGRYIGQLNSAMSLALNQELQSSEAGITSDQFRLLTHLWKENGLTQNVLAERTGRDRGSITRMLDILENKGITVRVADKNDRRVNLVYLTRKGESIRADAVRCAQSVLERATQGFDEKEKKEFGDFLKRTLKNMVDRN